MAAYDYSDVVLWSLDFHRMCTVCLFDAYRSSWDSMRCRVSGSFVGWAFLWGLRGLFVSVCEVCLGLLGVMLCFCVTVRRIVIIARVSYGTCID